MLAVFFQWMRQATKESILGGVNDALGELGVETTAEGRVLRVRLVSGPAIESDDAPKKGRKP